MGIATLYNGGDGCDCDGGDGDGSDDVGDGDDDGDAQSEKADPGAFWANLGNFRQNYENFGKIGKFQAK